VPATGFAVYRCDDGVPDYGGTTPNPNGDRAVTVPAKYGGIAGDSFTGLPGRAADATTVPGSDASGNVALDVDVTLPSTPAPAGGYPLLVMMHGCCSGSKASWEATSFDTGGERWHYSNAWFAARGYVVVTYTSRGFVDANGHGSTGQIQLDSRSYEVNDYQSLACQVAGAAAQFSDVSGTPVSINAKRIVTTGGSYGGGFSWMTLTDPRWTCTADTGALGKAMQLAATAPKYGWSDLVNSLVPTGRHSGSPSSLPATNGCDSGPRQLDGTPCPAPQSPAGMAKRSIVAGLFGTGTGIPGQPHTTFPASVDEAFACLNGPYPYELSPACANTVANTLPDFLRERSAYYQNGFFQQIAKNAAYRVPVFNAATLTDPLFPAVEDRQITNRLLSVVPKYPIQTYHGDYQHFTQNKAKIWGDLCGADHHVCTSADYAAGFNAAPSGLVRTGVTTRLNRFIDHYAHPSGDPNAPQPTFDVTAELQVCDQNAAASGVAPDEPGQQFTAPTFAALAPNALTLDLAGAQTTTSTVPGNTHALHADPVYNQVNNANKCVVETDAAGPGVAAYDGPALTSAQTMIGSTVVTATFAPNPLDGLELNARLYDVFPDGSAVLVDRGSRRVTVAEGQAGTVSFELNGNAWRFDPGHHIRIELAQDDEPSIAASTIPSSLSLSGVRLRLPVR
jgi:dienelactone hydrolase